MCSQYVITSIVNEFRQRITLKQNQVFRNQNLLHVSLPIIILLTKHESFWVGEFLGSHRRLRTPSYNFTGFHRWTHMYNQKYWGFHSRGVSIPACYYPTQVFMLCEQWNSTELRSTVHIPLINHQRWCVMTLFHILQTMELL